MESNKFKVGDLVECIEGCDFDEQPLREGVFYFVSKVSGSFVSLNHSHFEWYANRFRITSPLNTPVLYDHATGQTEPVSVRDTQIGGAHYHTMGIQPYEYSLANNLGALEHTAIKYVSRWRKKNGIEDLKKAIHTLQYLIEYTEKNGMPT